MPEKFVSEELKAKLTERFVQGYACAISSCVSSHGDDAAYREALQACGLTSVKALKRFKVDPYDIEILTPLVEELERREKL